MASIALYPGSFDPSTNGHLAIIAAALRLFDRVVVGIGRHATKATLLPVEDRIWLVKAAAASLVSSGSRLDVASFDALTVDFAREVGATAIIRGLRGVADLDYEMQMAGVNGALAPNIQTVFIPATPDTRHISATLVRQIHAMGGDIAPFVPPMVAEALAAR